MAFDYFRDVVTGDEFKQMDSDLLRELLSNDNVYVDSEVDIFNALVVWTEIDIAERMHYIQDLMQAVRVRLLKKSVCTFCLINAKEVFPIKLDLTIFSSYRWRSRIGTSRSIIFIYMRILARDIERV